LGLPFRIETSRKAGFLFLGLSVRLHQLNWQAPLPSNFV